MAAKGVAAKPKSRQVSAKWRKLLALLPGYDSFATAAPGEWFDPAAAQRACDFFPECLHHVEGACAGQPFTLEPWEQALIGALFGWKRADGTRRYREGLLMVARGNGKTPLGAGICLYVLFCDGEPGAQIYGAAAEAKQAGLVYRHAAGMVKAEAELSSRCKLYEGFGQRAIQLLADPLSGYQVVTSDAESKHGYNPHLVICDELHAWPNRRLMDAFETAFAKKSRRQPLLLSITTADYEREGSVCNEKQDYAEKVAAGIIKDSAFLPVIYKASRDDDWTDENVWKKANPNLDVTVDRESLRRFAGRAKELPSRLNEFLRLHLNVRTEQDVRWLEMTAWDECGGPVAEDALRGKPCFAGLDLSSTTDVSALVLLFPLADSEDDPRVPDLSLNDRRRYAAVCRFWIPSSNAQQRERADRVPYTAWARDGYLTTTPGEVIDYDRIRRDICELGKVYDIREIAIDRWNATQLAQQLTGDGFTVAAFGQGYKDMSAPAKELEALVISRRLRHGGQPVLRWMASNVSIESDAAGNIKPSKAKSTERIDGIVALTMALGRAMVQPTAFKSRYETEGLVFV